MIGNNVGGYVILSRIGAGAMGEVYLAQHRRLDRRAAIKILLPGLSKDPDLVARFFNEARALSRIQHPGIVEVYDCDVLEDRAYIIMEYLEGESMATVLERTGSVAAEAAAVAAVTGQIAIALGAAHAKGIVHRDLKPENVYFVLGQQAPFAVKVLDFGIAKLATDNFGNVSQTRPGSLLGTPAYMSPEQCRGVAGIDHRADVYAMGCMLFEMLTGRHVFEAEHFGDLIVAHMKTPAPLVSTLVPGIPAILDDLVARMLAKSPDDRPQSMDQVIATIEQFLDLPASAFGHAIPPDSRMVPLAAGRAVPPTQAMPVVPPADRPAARRVQALPVAPAPVLVAGTPGGTQVLPEAESSRPVAASSTPNESTFRRSASEIITPAADRRRRPLRIASGIVGLGAAIGVAVLLLSGPRGRGPASGGPSPAAGTPVVAPAPAVVPAPADEPPPPPQAAAPVESTPEVQAPHPLDPEPVAGSSNKPSSQKPGRKGSKNHGSREPLGVKTSRPEPKPTAAPKPGPSNYYHPVGD